MCIHVILITYLDMNPYRKGFRQLFVYVITSKKGYTRKAYMLASFIADSNNSRKAANVNIGSQHMKNVITTTMSIRITYKKRTCTFGVTVKISGCMYSRMDARIYTCALMHALTYYGGAVFKR